MGKYDLLFRMNIVVQDLGGKLLHIKRIPYLIGERKSLKKNSELFQKKKSDKCYIIGLGPSLKKINLGLLDGDTIATNRFFRVDQEKAITPTFYIFMDDAFYCGSAVDDLKTACREYPNTAFILNGKYHRESETILPPGTYAYYMYAWKGLFSGKEKLAMDRVMPAFGNVACCAIAVALSLGYKEILLLGCDFNSFATQKPEHAYYEDASRNKLRSLADELFCYSFEADLHNVFAKYAQKNGIKIKNGSEGSLIDSYPFLDKGEMAKIKR